MDRELKLDIFEIKQKFLREFPHPKLILKQIKILAQKGSLEEFDLGQPSKNRLDKRAKEQALTVYLNAYILESLQIKQRISNAPGYDSLHSELVNLYCFQWEFLKKLASYLPEQKTYPNQDIKMSSPIDAYQILKRIQQLNLNENGINTYLCNEIENTAVMLPDVLTASCLQAQKMVSHV